MDSLESASELARVVRNVAVPTLDRLVSPDWVLSEWLEGRSPGLSKPLALLHLAALLKSRGREPEAIDVCRELKELSAQVMVPAWMTNAADRLVQAP
ncbi:MAG: hypothetical protein AAF690_29075 [Acidobacteriota bacterium]